MNDYGIVLKRNDDDYVINVDANEYSSGYNVVPKSVDPYNAYDIDDVKAYCEQNPDKVLTEHPLEGMMEIQNQIAQEQEELNQVNQELFDRMVQKVFNPDTSIQEDLVPTNEELLAQKAELESSIETLKSQLDTMFQSLNSTDADTDSTN